MWVLDYKESWALKNWCLWTVVLEKILESPLDCKEIKPVNSKGNQSWIFNGRTDAETEARILWLHDAKSWLIRKDSERLKTAGEGDGIGWDSWIASPTQWTWVWASSRKWWRTANLACYSPWGHKRVRHNWASELKQTFLFFIHVNYMESMCHQAPGEAGQRELSVLITWVA